MGAAAQPDFIFSFYYRYMLDQAWLALPRRGALNIHGSLLPKYRGRAPVHWAIIHGESMTGASLHYMVEKPDAGALVDQEAVPILENDTALDVSIKVAGAAETVLRRSLPKLIAGTASSKPLDLGPRVLFRPAAAAPKTDASTGDAARAQYTTWCVPSHRHSPAPLPKLAVRIYAWHTRDPPGYTAREVPGPNALPILIGRCLVRRLRRRAPP